MANDKPQAHDFTEHTLDSREAYHGRMLRVFEGRVRLSDGAEAKREFVRHPGAVIIVPFLDAIRSAAITDTKTVWAMLWIEQFGRQNK